MRRMTRHWPWAAATAGLVANGLRLRSRVSQLPILDDDTTARPVGQTGTGTDTEHRFGDDIDAEYGLVTALGVAVDDATFDAACRRARAHDLDVLDLVPGDLELERLYELARLVNPKTYRDDRLATGRGAGHATLVRTGLLDELALRSARVLDPVEYVETMLQLKKYAPTGTDLVVAPRLHAVPLPPEWRLPRMRALYGSATPGFAAVPVAEALLLSAGPVLGRAKGTAALAAYLAQPFLVAAGGPVKPHDLKVLTALGRAGRELRDAVGSLRAGPPAAVRHRAERAANDDETRRTQYVKLMERASAFFEPPLASCPWCDSDDLHYLLEVPDLLQGKPGRFRLDECGACGHIFQNPRLSIEGLDFYYRDFYDGLGDEGTELVFSMGSRSYQGRAAMLQGVATPKRWLDVGSGHGHFCLVAKELWPETAFDGLDLSDSVIDAERRGWIQRAYKGLFPDLAPELSGSYDVVSMHHYLEHTRDPAVELDAAHLALEDGGHLLIEVPNPDSRLGRALGWTWGPWFQPQHQHFVPLDNLTAALEDRGFTMVSAERGPAHQAVDLAFSLWLVANRIAPAGDRPWNPRQTLAQRAGRAATWTVGTPLLAAALLTDQAIAPILRRMPRMSNTYRVLARKG
jgi:SAM-dependent methyltransferase